MVPKLPTQHRRTNLGAIIGGLLVAVATWLTSGATAARAADPPNQVTLVIDYGDGVQKRFTAIPHKPEMTILDALDAAQRHPRGIQFEYRGKEATAFLLRIDDRKNEGRGRNWVFSVNKQLGDRSFAVHKLRPGDEVEWKFSTYP